MNNKDSLMNEGWMNISRYSISILAIIMLLSISTHSVADYMDDFEKAAGEKGCKSIPFSRPRSECIDIQKDVTEYCKTDVVPCSDLLKTKSDLIDDIKKSNRQVEQTENKRKQVEEKLARTDVEGEIKKYERELAKVSDEYQEDLDKHNELLDKYEDFDDVNKIQDGYESAQNCVKAREKSRDLFDDVKDHLYVDGSTLTEKEEMELEHLAVKITDHINSEIKGHDTALSDAKDRVKNCKKVLDKEK